jgi:hypothetical protein
MQQGRNTVSFNYKSQILSKFDKNEYRQIIEVQKN